MASDFKLSVVLEAVTAAFNSSIKQAAATFTKAEADMASAATSAGSAATSAGAAEVTAARNAGNAATEAAGQSAAAARSAAAANAAVRPPSSFKEFFAGMKDGWQQAMASARTATADTAAAADSAGNHIKGLKDQIDGVGPAAKKSGAAANEGLTLGGLVKSVAAVVGLKEAIGALVTNATQMQQITNQLNFATGGAAQGAAAFAFLRDTANSLGLSLEGSAKGFAQLATSTKGTALEGKATQDLFLGISQAAATMGLSVDDTNGVFLALSQIASKGVVQMDDLRGQLGDRLPGVMKVAADSMHVTVDGLNNLVASGLDSTKFLTAFGPALQSAFSESAGKNLATLGGQITLLKNQFFELLTTINQSGAAGGLTAIVKDVSAGLAKIADLFKQASGSPEFEQFRQAIGGAYDDVKTTVETVIGVVTSLYGVFNDLYATAQDTFSLMVTGSESSSEKISLLEAAFGVLRIAVAAIADGFKTIQIVIELASGSIAFFQATAFAGLSKLAGLVNKELGQSLLDFSDKLYKAADKSFAKADAHAKGFKSSVVGVIDDVGKAAADAVDNAGGTKTLEAANAALVALVKTAAEGKAAPAALQAQADAAAAAFEKLGARGTVSADVLKASLAAIAGTLPKLVPPVETFLGALARLGPLAVEQLHDVSEGTAKSLVSLAGLAASAKTTSLQFKTAFADLIQGAKTKADIDLINQSLASLGPTGKITAADIKEALNELGDQARRLGPEIGQSYEDSLKRVGAATKQELSNAVNQAEVDLRRVQELYAQNKVGVEALIDAQAAYANAQAKGVQAALTGIGAQTEAQANAALAQAASKLEQIKALYAQGALGIAALVKAQTAYADAQAKAVQDALTSVGAQTKAQAEAAVATAAANLEQIKTLFAQGEVSYKAIADAQAKLSAAQAAATPGVVTLADVTKRLADINRDCADAVVTNTKHIDTFAESVAKSAVESAKLTSAGTGLAGVFNDQKSALLALSAAAANDFGARLGIQFGYIEAGAESSQKTIEGLTQELGRLSQFSASPDFTGIGTKFREIAAAGVATQLAFEQEKQATDAAATAIENLANSGTASLKDLQRAAAMGVSPVTLLGNQDLSRFRSALDSAKNRIDEIKNASLSTADALKAMGDSFQIEILRAQGNNVAAIQAEAAAQAADIDKQIEALGPNASADAIAAAKRAKDLLAQITAQKIAEQKASDAAAAADKKAAADKTPDIVVPPQASAPVPPTTTATTAANDPTITGGKLITLRFEDASGKATTVTAPTQQSADDLLAILKRAGATNIAQAGS